MVEKIKRLLEAIDAWCMANQQAADIGLSKEVSYGLDDARDTMLSCVNDVRKLMVGDRRNTVVVVTISETLPAHGNEVDTVVFSGWDKAAAWVESQIDSTVKAYELDRESAVDGWFVEIDHGHTIQYVAKERLIQ